MSSRSLMTPTITDLKLSAMVAIHLCCMQVNQVYYLNLGTYTVTISSKGEVTILQVVCPYKLVNRILYTYLQNLQVIRDNQKDDAVVNGKTN